MNTADSVPLENFSIAEKLVLMERLWSELSRCPENVPSPLWHGDILAERLAAVQAGTASFVDWEEAKQRLRERLNHPSA
jgi:hypothetical protein